MLKEHLKQLAEDLELEPVNADKEGVFSLQLNTDIKVALRELEPGLFIFSPIARCPKEKKEELFTLLMRGNYLGLGTGGGTIALDNEEKLLTLSSTLPYDMNYRHFKEQIEDFVNFVEYWKVELANFEKIHQM